MDNGASSYRRFLNGEESAFEELMKELFHGLVFFIDGFVRDSQAAEDIAIDVFSDLVVHRHRYNFKVSLKTYLYMLGRSRALDYLRRRKRQETEELSQSGEIADEASTPEEQLLRSERKRQLHTAIALLQPDMRAVIHLVYFEDMTYEDAARVLKKSRKQVDNLLYRAKKELRIILGKDGIQ